MERIDLDMDEIFDEPGADDSDDEYTVTALPDLQLHADDQGQERTVPFGDGGDNDQDANVDVLARLHNLAKGAAKKVVKRPQPKLDSTRLSGPRGFQLLPNILKDLNFKGQGYETHDLDLLMKNYEHWAHRLFPKMKFDDVIDRVEKLGAKREIQTMLKKMRMGIPLLLGEQDGSGTGEGETDRQEDNEADREESALDAIFRAERETTATPSTATPTPNTATPTLSPSTPTQITTTASGMSESQKERIERNKRMALEKRLARQATASPYSRSQVSRQLDKSSCYTPRAGVKVVVESSGNTQHYKETIDIGDSSDLIIGSTDGHLINNATNSVVNEGSITVDTTESVVDDTTESVVDDTTESVVDGTTESVVDDTTESVVDDTTESVVDDTTESVVDGTTESVVDGTTESVVDDTTESVVDDTTESVVDTDLCTKHCDTEMVKRSTQYELHNGNEQTMHANNKIVGNNKLGEEMNYLKGTNTTQNVDKVLNCGKDGIDVKIDEMDDCLFEEDIMQMMECEEL